MRPPSKSLFWLLLFLILAFALPLSFSNLLRKNAVGLLHPYWTGLSSLWETTARPLNFFHSESEDENKSEIDRLRLENELLKNELGHLKELFAHEQYLVQNRSKETDELFNIELSYTPARVIFRPLNEWHRFCWIDKGEKENQRKGKTVIAKNSPVVIGSSIVGVIEEVGVSESLVRLITDPKLRPSVRVKRGAWLLAKGEMAGANLQGVHDIELKGQGFNYNFPDKAGPARDLRTGQSLDAKRPFPSLPIIQLHDLLITTGMDGVFPPGLHVGYVRKILPLKEGAVAYEVGVEPAVSSLYDLTDVFVLPPRLSSEEVFSITR